jgi:chloramphenicol 3-O phosphotransferase
MTWRFTLQTPRVSERFGRIIVLNGASSVGKSTIATQFVGLRAERGECWVIVGIDDFLVKLPWQWFDTELDGPYGADGFRFEPSPDGVVASVGEVGRRLLATYRRSVALWSRQGFDVIVDDVTFDADAAADWDVALAERPVTWVGVQCDPAVAEARERARGDRVPGLARGLSAVVHAHRSYDLELDSTFATPDALVAALDAFVT